MGSRDDLRDPERQNALEGERADEGVLDNRVADAVDLRNRQREDVESPAIPDREQHRCLGIGQIEAATDGGPAFHRSGRSGPCGRSSITSRDIFQQLLAELEFEWYELRTDDVYGRAAAD
ncbi:hypothetical protein [Natrarchaeobius chitinivorans]|uniref:Uncharacterized protein n=1 Tax=Natrarchaeobius chitinivorans TaxID=1679083 RepID=A0A3N6MM38_NATCH|nr:hypothetical protein [Natrarchaeobius chitinivorans]RQG95486.1 hypothetical protein EA473_08485 [Natrarchaeobius chitinivorans]